VKRLSPRRAGSFIAPMWPLRMSAVSPGKTPPRATLCRCGISRRSYCAQLPRETALASEVTAASSARARPLRLLPLVRLLLAEARMLPVNELLVPRLADVPTFQNTLQGLPLPAMAMEEPEAVVMALPTWKIHAAFGPRLRPK
jgi:hypothetical protein